MAGAAIAHQHYAPLQLKLAEKQFPEALRLATSVQHGTVTASLILRKLSAYPRQNGLALALREPGRITIFGCKNPRCVGACQPESTKPSTSCSIGKA
jgi:TnpA family transposase